MPRTAAYPENRTHPGGPVIGRRLSFDSVSKAGARFAAKMKKPDIAARAAEPDEVLLEQIACLNEMIGELERRLRAPARSV